uniref:Uncharacterized protein LOC111104031 n=1 Tax=Crassostrea virginica TaxID=6565 RepID=A0A8B8APJ4_CRAVI|nr:uncharacterized protein LOC111104031 [Crassostrea virginica]
MNVQGVPLFAGDMYTYHHNPETGKEKHGILKRFIDDVNHDVFKAVIQPYESINCSGRSGQISAMDDEVTVPVTQLRECKVQAYCKLGKRSPLTVEKLPVWTLPINIFIDDTSANRSKRWLGLHCIQMQLAGLKLNLRQGQDSIQLLSASEKVEPLTLMQPLISDIQTCKRTRKTEAEIQQYLLHTWPC